MPKKSRFFFITVLVLTFAISLTLADLFSSVITVGNFAFLPSQSAKSPGYQIYAISLFKAPNHSQASVKVQEIKLRGGAGFIYSNSGIYYVLASAYENENDAISVQNSLEEQNVESEILTISISEIALETTFSGTEKNNLMEVLSGFKNTFKVLYDISVSLDTGIKNAVEAKIDVQSHYNKVLKTKQDFDNIFKNKLTNEIFQIKLKLTQHLTELESVIEMDYTDRTMLTGLIKETYLDIIVLNKTLANDLRV